ncbi:MAG: helix-turn-helix transcriptional regulator [Burkholderiaceae bacterium]|nr:helix-turn-helix transcriptional regulator [Burkholderiaceae bacterium]
MHLPHLHRQALARLHRMACLPAGGVQRIEPLLQALRPVVAFDFGGFLYPGMDGQLQAHLQDGPLHAVLADSFDPRILRSESQVLVRSSHDFAGAARHEHGPLLLRELVKVPASEFQRSDFYNVVARPGGGTEYLKLVLRTPQGVGLGALFLFREAASPWFTTDDVAALAQLEPLLARILQDGELDSANSMVLADGMLVVSSSGGPRWTTPEAEALLGMAFGWRWRRGADLPPALQELVRRVQGPGSLLPALELRTSQGWFSLRATLLAARDEWNSSATSGSGCHAVALHITRRVPRDARLLAALETLELPPRQHEMGWWLAQGLSESQIALRMGISLNTAVYHRRQLYNRLGVANKDTLLLKMFQSYASGQLNSGS